MADPIISGLFKAMWIWRGKSGLPEDRFINNWVFEMFAGSVSADRAGDIQRILEAFYLAPAANGTSIVSRINGSALDAAQPVELRVYDLGEAPPRTPVLKYPTVTLNTSGSGLPLEVCSVLSFRSDKNGPRGKGRLYLGPLTTGALGLNSNGYPIVLQTFREAVADRAADVMNTSENYTWCQLSKMDGEAKGVTGGWIDDAFDTQRRRGNKATVRTKFGSAYVLAA